MERHDDPAPAPNEEPILITDRAELDAAVGKLVTLEGIQTRTKIPTVLGVDVDGDYELSDTRVRVTGILERHVVPEREFDPDEPAFAHRGAGTFYSIIDPNTQTLARPVRAQP